MSTFVARKKTRRFWYRLLKRRHTSYGEIARDLGYNISVVRSYFIGKKYPKPEIISAICDYLLIDVDTGTQEFMKSHRVWCRNTGAECKIPESDILKHRKDSNATMRKLPTNKPPHYITYDNFWQRLRVDAGYSFSDLSKLLGISKYTIADYFRGKSIPKESTLKKICDTFNVDYETGLREFTNAFNQFTEMHSDVYIVTKNSHQVKPCKSSSAVNIKPIPISVAMKSAADFADILKMLYGKIPYDLFGELVAYSSDDILQKKYLKTLYGNVDYTTFQTLIR